jgi:molybdenum cofactor cytidylyltransferase
MSSRMGGANKLLAAVDGEAVVARVVDAALASCAAPVVVVTGHDADGVCAALAGRQITRAHNPDYARGLSSSLHAGLGALGREVDGALICLGDMPWVGAADLDALIAAFAHRAERPICVPVFDRKRGNPVLWPARYFAALRALDGDVGGRDLLRRCAGEVLEVPTSDPGVTRDVDTPADLSASPRRPA